MVTVFIYQDPWLPSNTDPMVELGDQSLIGEKVSSLFSVGERAWDVDVVKDLFSSEEARLILGILLSVR